MKKILIVNNNMQIGGVQKALCSLLWEIYDRYDVTLLLFHAAGDCLDELPPDIKVETVTSAYRYLGMTKYDVEKNFGLKLRRSFFAAISRLIGKKYAIALMGLTQKKLQGFDVAMSYLHDSSNKAFYGGCNDFVLKHVSAKKKITFLHCDYMNCGADTKENAKRYAQFDVVAACSEGCRASFLRANEKLAGKTVVVRNCHRFDQIQRHAEALPVTPDADRLSVVTVARLGREKSVGRAVRAIEMLGPLKEQVHYYIVGDGIERDDIQKQIESAGLNENVSLCGEQANPYGYMKAADLLLISSVSEAAPLVIDEAASLGTPILSTRTSSADEMIDQRGLGWVCDNSEAGLMSMLRTLIETPELLVKKKMSLKEVVFDNEVAVQQFIQAVEKL